MKRGPIDTFLAFFPDFHLEELERWHDQVERTLKRGADQIAARFEKELPAAISRSDDEADLVAEILSDEAHRHEVTFPDMARKALFTTGYFDFEHDLERLCRIYWRELALKSRLEESRGRGVQRSFVYLESVVKLNLSAVAEPIAKIRFYNFLRNAIAHNGGKVQEKQRDRLANEGELHPGIEVVGRSEFSFSNEFLPSVFKTLRLFWKFLNDNRHPGIG